jgi:hypothetical protein
MRGWAAEIPSEDPAPHRLAAMLRDAPPFTIEPSYNTVPTQNRLSVSNEGYDFCDEVISDYWLGHLGKWGPKVGRVYSKHAFALNVLPASKQVKSG